MTHTGTFQTMSRPSLLALRGQLQAAAGLRVEHIDIVLWIPALREELSGWEFKDRTVRVYSLIPAHPYLREVMTAAGGRRDTAAYSGVPIRHMLHCERLGTPCSSAIASCLRFPLYGVRGLSIGCSRELRVDGTAPQGEIGRRITFDARRPREPGPPLLRQKVWGALWRGHAASAR